MGISCRFSAFVIGGAFGWVTRWTLPSSVAFGYFAVSLGCFLWFSEADALRDGRVRVDLMMLRGCFRRRFK
jgi:hypothetical protein